MPSSFTPAKETFAYYVNHCLYFDVQKALDALSLPSMLGDLLGEFQALDSAGQFAHPYILLQTAPQRLLGTFHHLATFFREVKPSDLKSSWATQLLRTAQREHSDDQYLMKLAGIFISAVPGSDFNYAVLRQRYQRVAPILVRQYLDQLDQTGVITKDRVQGERGAPSEIWRLVCDPESAPSDPALHARHKKILDDLQKGRREDFEDD